MNDKHRRSIRNFLINKDVQGPVVLLVVVIGFLCSLLNGTLYYVYVKNSYTVFFRNFDVPQDFIDNRFSDLLDFGLILVLISAGITLIFACYSLVISHRSAGAAYRIHKVMEEIKAGNVDARVHLRQKDDYQELAQTFNEMVDGFNLRKEDKEESRRASTDLSCEPAEFSA